MIGVVCGSLAYTRSGVATDLVLIPSLDVACVVLSNRRDRKFLSALRDRILQTVIPDWHANLDAPEPAPQPLEPLASYLGTWRGTLRAQGVDVPVELRIAPDRSGTLAIGAGAAAPIKDLRLTNGLLSSDSRGDIGSPDTRRHHLEQISLNLKLRGTRIDGEIFAWKITDREMTILPHWTTLQRP